VKVYDEALVPGKKGRKWWRLIAVVKPAYRRIAAFKGKWSDHGPQTS
jgi:hypothetical protein